VSLPVDENSIQDAEREGAFRFPAEWKRALMGSNGFDVKAGDDNWRAFPVKDARSKKQLARSCNHVLLETSIFQEFPLLPKDAIAIASNGAGDALIILNNSNQVQIWSHETGALSDVGFDFING
jgi:hypothetical protein